MTSLDDFDYNKRINTGTIPFIKPINSLYSYSL
jgi:hypothetical protein